jgi:hypothetical protein
VTLLIASIPKNWKQYNTDRAMSASYHDIHLEINSADGRLETKPELKLDKLNITTKYTKQQPSIHEIMT